MTITVSRLAPSFAARIDGADITRPLPDVTVTIIRPLYVLPGLRLASTLPS